jgi:lysophospholipase L1-like esterase
MFMSHCMPSRFLLLIASTLLVLTGAADLAQASPGSGRAPSTGTQVIEYYGDSTVWGYRSEAGGQVSKPAPTAFAEALPNKSNYEVRNEGVSGSTACELLSGTDGKHLPWPVQMAASRARYVLINFAINDQWKHDVDTYQSCLRSLARIAKKHGKQMIFETPNPTRDSGRSGLDVYVDAMKEVAAQEKLPVIDQYQYLSDFLNGQSPYTICPDGLHPSDRIYVLKGRFAAKVFSGLFPEK